MSARMVPLSSERFVGTRLARPVKEEAKAVRAEAKDAKRAEEEESAVRPKRLAKQERTPLRQTPPRPLSRKVAALLRPLTHLPS